MSRRHHSVFFAAALLAVAALPFPAGAQEVNPQNGNFSAKFTDITYPGGLNLKLERVYNSKTPYRGMFGWGWGTELELYLDVLGDGSVLVHEFGGGAENMFVPAGLSSGDIDASIEQLANARAGEAAMSADSLIAYRSRLREDAVHRSEEWTRLAMAGRVAPRVLPEGTRLRSLRFGRQDVIKSASGYRREGDNGKIEHFDERGRLVRVEQQKAHVALEYDADGRLATVRDELGRSITFEYDARNRVVRATGSHGSPATYGYDANDDLVSSTDADGLAHRYTYDGRHNLVRIDYPDEESVTVAYHPPALNENVSRMTGRDGYTSIYEYEPDPGDELLLTVTVRRVDETEPGDPVPLGTTVYEYTDRRRANGDLWTERVVTTVNSRRTDATYSECCGLPLRVVVGGYDTTTFEYDRAGNLTRKETRESLDSLQYTPVLQRPKIARIVRMSKDDMEPRWTAFTYSDDGNLTRAADSQGLAVDLFYDENAKIVKMVSGETTMNFAYNEIGKPIRIEVVGTGGIDVEYDHKGEITRVNSDGGHTIALTVTQQFQNLMGLVNTKDLAPCRVSFSASTCARKNRPIRLPQLPAPREGGACIAAERICRVGGNE